MKKEKLVLVEKRNLKMKKDIEKWQNDSQDDITDIIYINGAMKYLRQSEKTMCIPITYCQNYCRI